MSITSVSVVIPTLEGNPLTLESIPDGVETVVVSEGNRSEARNIGAERTSGEILVFCDDDIVFEESFFWEQVGRLSRGTVIGLEDFDFGLLLTRFLFIYREDFERLGGFDERLNHMEDTEFSLNAISNDLKICTVDRDLVTHREHDSVGQETKAILWGTLYICFHHPRHTLFLINKLLYKRC